MLTLFCGCSVGLLWFGVDIVALFSLVLTCVA